MSFEENNPAYSQNFILCGEIDFYCLLCQDHFPSLETVNEHIALSRHHKMSAKQQKYDNRYIKESIYKIRDQLYCEVCNELVTDAQLHKISVPHREAKRGRKEPKYYNANKLLITRQSNNSVKIGEKHVLTDLQWNGIHDDFCSLCVQKVTSGPWRHMYEKEHVLNLIKTTLTKVKQYYYRMVDEDKFFCFECIDTFEIKSIEYHMILSCKKLSKHKENIVPRKPYSQLKKILKSYSELKKFYVIEEKTENKVKCLTCDKQIEGHYETMIQHKNRHVGGILNLVDHGKRRHDLAEYGRLNYLKLNESGSWAHCSLCNVVFSASIHQAIKHVDGEQHKTCQQRLKCHPSMMNFSVPLETILFALFLSQVHRIYDDFFTHEFRREISFESFMLMSRYGFGNKHICNLCNEIMLSDNINIHCKTDTHLNKMLDCLVINEPHMRLEFVRMIRQDVYHCGICNLILPSWALMARHIKSVKHLVRKKLTSVTQFKTAIMHRKNNLPCHTNVPLHFSRLRLV